MAWVTPSTASSDTAGKVHVFDSFECAIHALALNDRGVRTARGGRWHCSSVRNVMARIEHFPT